MDLPPPLLVGVDEAARLLSVSRVSIYRLVNAGALRLVKLGRRSGVPMADLQKLASGSAATEALATRPLAATDLVRR